jgi:hypothetical protein
MPFDGLSWSSGAKTVLHSMVRSIEIDSSHSVSVENDCADTGRATDGSKSVTNTNRDVNNSGIDYPFIGIPRGFSQNACAAKRMVMNIQVLV